MRPDVAAAFDRMAAAAARATGSRWSSPPPSAPTPSRRELFAAAPRPPLGGAAGPLAPPLRDRARPRARRPPTAGWPRTRRASASSSATRGSRGTSATTAARRRARPRATPSDSPADGGDGAGRRRPAGLRARRSFATPILRAAARWNVSAGLLAAQLMAESSFNPYAVSARGRAGDRPVHARTAPPTASAIRSTRRRRSTPRPT